MGVAEERFEEDGLRVLRAFRFLDAGKMGIREMDDSLRSGILSSEEFLQGISRERVGMEMTKILTGENVRSIIYQMLPLGVLDRVFENISVELPPELSTEYLVNLALLFRNSGLSGEELASKMRDLLVLSKNDLLEISMMHECRQLSLDETIESARRFYVAVPNRRKKLIIDYLEKIGIETEKFEKLFRSINPGDLILDPIVKGEKLVFVTGLPLARDWEGSRDGYIEDRSKKPPEPKKMCYSFSLRLTGSHPIIKNGNPLAGPSQEAHLAWLSTRPCP